MKERSFLSPVTENFLHAIGVGKVSYELAKKFEVDPKCAFVAGVLHDLGGAIPDSDRVEVAELYHIPLFKEEKMIPMLVHAKQGEFFARNLFKIEDPEILNAILYHTTYIDDASSLVKIVFIADKIHWDRNGEPPYLKELLKALEQSLDEGCKYFLEWLWQSDLYVVHPFLRRSYGYYIQNQTFSSLERELLTNEKTVQITSEIRKKYFLNEIICEFEKIFERTDNSSDLAKSKNVDVDEAFIAAALMNISNTISESEKPKVISALQLDPNVSNVAAQINYYFAKTEFDVKNPRILEIILNAEE
ncbi:TPA: bis(5'-nucleosyl)-tetraphosphatase (symmetrical) YqeK [Enterococcus faecium]|uniref:bis(5'-nucleosyl)-tetraphosphatase (symmetrical) YqeK n=2 Tax=Enterococcus TaxID=1350 RepID=UPI0031CD31BA